MDDESVIEPQVTPRMPIHDSVAPDRKPLQDQPQWRKDFSIDWSQDDYVARRDFTKFMVLTSFAFVVGQFWIVLQNLARRRQGKPPVRRIAAAGDLDVGQAMTFAYPEAHDDSILVRLSEDEFVAYSQKCTHLACAVRPSAETGRLHCPCHEGFFDMEDGRPLAGPPRRPLPRILLEVRGGQIYATGVELRTT